jgi:hypothetical protein
MQILSKSHDCVTQQSKDSTEELWLVFVLWAGVQVSGERVDQDSWAKSAAL